MRDEIEAPEAPAAPQPKLKPANENPWYVLMTLYGDDHERNRLVWNAWAGQALTVGERNALVEKGMASALDVENLHALQQKITATFKSEFARRNVAKSDIPELPNPNHPVRLAKIYVEEEVNLSGRIFPRGLHLSNVRFGKNFFAEFSSFEEVCSASKVEFEGKVSFFGAEFGSDSNFSCFFKREVTFEYSRFKGQVTFKSTFGGDADFRKGKFVDEVNFLDAVFEGSSNFNAANFSGRVKFSGVSFGRPSSSQPNSPSFRDCQFQHPTSFHQAVFWNAYPDFSGAILHDKTTFTARRTPTESEVKSSSSLKGALYWPDHTQQDPESVRETCSTIRHILAKQGLPEDEHFFFRREMHFAGKIGSLWQRLPYLLFGLFSEYGYSILRPTLWLLGVWALGFAAFWGYLSGCCVPAPDTVIERPMGSAMALSFSNLFPLFGFGRVYFGAEFMMRLPAVLKTLAGLQTVASLPLLFFLGLGLRQRFRLR